MYRGHYVVKVEGNIQYLSDCMVTLANLSHCCLAYDRFSHDLPRFIVFFIGSNCVVFHFCYALSRQLVMKTKQVGIGNSIRIYVSHVLSTKTGPQTCVNWRIRYIMQDVGLKYLHL